MVGNLFCSTHSCCTTFGMVFHFCILYPLILFDNFIYFFLFLTNLLICCLFLILILHKHISLIFIFFWLLHLLFWKFTITHIHNYWVLSHSRFMICFLNFLNFSPCNGLLIKSASIPSVGQNLTTTLPCSTWSVIKSI